MKIVITIIALFISMITNAATGTKTYKKTFDKGGITDLSISNMYGDVEIKNSTDGKINIVTDINVAAKYQTKVDEILEYIFVVDNTSDYLLNVETRMEKDFTVQQLVSGVSMDIHYTVEVPAGVAIRVVNKSGDVLVEKFANNLHADIRDGNFVAGDLTGDDVRLILQGDSCVINNANMLTCDLKNVECNIQKAESLNLTAVNCTLQLGQISDLKLNTTGGVAKVESVDAISGNISSTKYEVMDISDVANVNMKWGEFNVANINHQFTEIRVKGSSAKVGLTFAANSAFQIELIYNKNVKLDMPEDMKLESIPSSEKNISTKKGSFGDGELSLGSKVFLDLRGGSVYVQ